MYKHLIYCINKIYILLKSISEVINCINKVRIKYSFRVQRVDQYMASRERTKEAINQQTKSQQQVINT